MNYYSIDGTLGDLIEKLHLLVQEGCEESDVVLPHNRDADCDNDMPLSRIDGVRSEDMKVHLHFGKQ